MQDRPSNAQLSEAVREFLETEILPVTTDARLKFRVLVAMNALGIVAREANLEEANVQAEFLGLKTLLGRKENPDSFSSLKAFTLELNTQLAGQIRTGYVPEGTFEHLEAVTKAKLMVSNPNYLKRYAE